MTNRREISAEVVADSITIDGHRLTTMAVTMHRFVLPEFNTHRAFSRNSASSRAIPTRKQLSEVRTNPANPIEWGSNQSGMQAGEPVSIEDADAARYLWVKAMNTAADASEIISGELNVHKQVANRILEPWMWHTVIVTATDYDNFFDQRCSPLAQPEIRVVAEKMEAAYEASIPVEVAEGDWHTPFIQEDEASLDLETRKKVSAARCARVSYLTHDGVRDVEKDLELYERLVTAEPPHASPLEHVARPDPRNIAFIQNTEEGYAFGVPILGNFLGWKQLRHEVANLDFFIW